MQKRPVSFNLSPKITNFINEQAQAEGRSRSSWLERHLETTYFNQPKEPRRQPLPPKPQEDLAIKFG